MPAKKTNSPNDITRYEVKTTAIRTLELHHRPIRERGFLPCQTLLIQSMVCEKQSGSETLDLVR